jgi:hypothetical protein
LDAAGKFAPLSSPVSMRRPRGGGVEFANPICNAAGRRYRRSRSASDGTQMTTSDIHRVAVLGTGIIGASWTAIFLSRGLDVAAFDPAPGAEAALRQAVAGHWPTMQQFGVAEDAAPDRLTFHPSASAAVRDAQFVQENGPERLDFKRALFKEMDAAAPADAVLASSSSTIMVSEFQDVCTHPSRVLLGHPFNPPHLIPLIEVAGGRQTSEAAIDTAMAFYAACGKHPIRLRKRCAVTSPTACRRRFGRRRFTWSSPASPAWPTLTPPSPTVPACAGRCLARS